MFSLLRRIRQGWEQWGREWRSRWRWNGPPSRCQCRWTVGWWRGKWWRGKWWRQRGIWSTFTLSILYKIQFYNYKLTTAVIFTYNFTSKVEEVLQRRMTTIKGKKTWKYLVTWKGLKCFLRFVTFFPAFRLQWSNLGATWQCWGCFLNYCCGEFWIVYNGDNLHKNGA